MNSGGVRVANSCAAIHRVPVQRPAPGTGRAPSSSIALIQHRPPYPTGARNDNAAPASGRQLYPAGEPDACPETPSQETWPHVTAWPQSSGKGSTRPGSTAQQPRRVNAPRPRPRRTGQSARLQRRQLVGGPSTKSAGRISAAAWVPNWLSRCALAPASRRATEHRQVVSSGPSRRIQDATPRRMSRWPQEPALQSAQQTRRGTGSSR